MPRKAPEVLISKAVIGALCALARRTSASSPVSPCVQQLPVTSRLGASARCVAHTCNAGPHSKPTLSVCSNFPSKLRSSTSKDTIPTRPAHLLPAQQVAVAGAVHRSQQRSAAVPRKAAPPERAAPCQACTRDTVGRARHRWDTVGACPDAIMRACLTSARYASLHASLRVCMLITAEKAGYNMHFCRCTLHREWAD